MKNGGKNKSVAFIILFSILNSRFSSPFLTFSYSLINIIYISVLL